LKEALQADEWSDKEKRRMQWQAITVAVEAFEEEGTNAPGGTDPKAQAQAQGANKKVVEETFYLPFQSSAYVLSFLFSACCEIHRVFAHVSDHALLRYLTSRLLLGVCDQYWQLGSEKKDQVSKEGAIQLMFDAKFLCDVLAAGASAAPADPELAQAVLAELSHGGKEPAEPPALKERIKGLHMQLQALLDSIDRAFYAPHVNRMEQQCYVRSAALLGPLVSLCPLYTQVKVQGVHGEQYNTLPLVASVPRFRYLPITEPQAKGKEKGSVASTFGLEPSAPAPAQLQQQQPQYSLPMLDTLKRMPSSPFQSASSLLGKNFFAKK